jgi:hypothetical protein
VLLMWVSCFGRHGSPVETESGQVEAGDGSDGRAHKTTMACAREPHDEHLGAGHRVVVRAVGAPAHSDTSPALAASLHLRHNETSACCSF